MPENEASLAELIAFLRDLDSYDHRPGSVQIVQTHASVVALAGEQVYKVKKPVNFGFLDYSTRQRRKHFAHREVELNRRLCPDVYLGVVPLVRRERRLAFAATDSAESPVEFAVHMRRLADAYFLSALLKQGGVGENDITRVIDVLVPFYAEQPAVAEGGTAEHIREAVIGNLDLCAKALGAVLPAASYEAIRHFSEWFIEANGDLFRKRIVDGRIKDGHGDLRPMHVHLAPDRVRIYDCIEFNDRLRCIDVAADLAFLSMELAFAGRWDLSEFFLTTMAKRLNDPEMPRALDFYQSYRAAVRGKVASLLAGEPEISEAHRVAALDEAAAYFRLALRYATVGAAPTILCVMGRIGTGKSTLAVALSQLLGWPVFSSDRVRKELAGVPLTTRVQGAARGRLYSEPMSQKTYARLTELAVAALGEAPPAATRPQDTSPPAKGGQKGVCVRGAIIDATFNRRAARKKFIEHVERRDGRVLFVELTAPDDLIRQRLAQREHAHGTISDARPEDFAAISGRYERPIELPENQLLTCDASLSSEEIARSILLRLTDRFKDRLGPA